MSIHATYLDVQQLLSYIEQPQGTVYVFATWLGSGVPPAPENWTWDEKTVQAPGNGSVLIVALGGAFNFLMIELTGN